MSRPSPINAVRSWAGVALVCSGVMIAPACSGKESSPPPAPEKAAVAAVKSPEARVQMYKDCWDAYNNQQWDKFGQCYAENAVSEEIDSTPPSVTGRAAIIERDKQSAAAFPDRRGDVKLILANGERIMSIALFTGTNSGPMPGPDGKPMPPTNKKIGLYIAHALEFDPTGAQGVRDAAYTEQGTLMAQLGVNPNPKARKALTSPGTTPIVVIGQGDAKEQSNLVLVQNVIDAFNRHDLKASETYLADDYKLVEIGQPKDLNRTEAMAGMKEFLAAFPDINVTPATKWAAGDYVVVEGTIDGTNKGPAPSMGIAKATNKPVSARFLEVYKLSNNKVQEDWLFYNGMAMAAQLGLVK